MKIVLSDPAVAAVGSFFGGGSGSALNNGRMFISLKPEGHGKGERTDTSARSSRACAESSRAFRARHSFFVPGQDIRVGGRSSKAHYQYALTDQNSSELNAVGAEARRRN